MDVGGAGARRAADAAAGMAGRLEPELPGRSGIEQPAGESAAVDEAAGLRRDALAVEGARAKAARTVGIVEDVHAGGEQQFVLVADQEARLAGDRWAGHRADEMAQ